MKVVVAAWLGAGNLGDELLFLALRRELARVEIEPVALSLDHAATSALHGVAAVDHLAAVGAIGRTSGLVFGGGGLVQDETSLLSPLYQLSRPGLARLRRRPTIGVGLGAGPLRSRVGRAAAVGGLGGALRVVARDGPSADVMLRAGLRPQRGADLVFLLEPPRVETRDEIIVSTRPKFARGGLVPGRMRTRQPDEDPFARSMALQLGSLARVSGSTIAFLSMEPARDDPLHEAIAARLDVEHRWVRPRPSEVLATVAGARLVIASRFHAGVAAVLGRRPTVMLGYAPKVQALAQDVGRGVRLVDHATSALAGLGEAGRDLLERDERPGSDAVARLAQRARMNRSAVEALAEAISHAVE